MFCSLIIKITSNTFGFDRIPFNVLMETPYQHANLLINKRLVVCYLVEPFAKFSLHLKLYQPSIVKIPNNIYWTLL